jgi:circadian clock protein KaiC
MAVKSKLTQKLKEVPKTSTGIRGLDEITYGGILKARPTLVCGAAGSGKTIDGYLNL